MSIQPADRAAETSADENPISALCCPRDGSELARDDTPTRAQWRCRECSGVFVESVIADPPPAQAGDGAATHSVRSMGASSATCPADGALMTTYRCHEVEIDYCELCGATWLDRGELEKVLGRTGGAPAIVGAVAAGAAASADAAGLALDGASAIAGAVVDEVVAVAIAGILDALF